MFCMGHVFIGNYYLWINSSELNINSLNYKDCFIPYFEVLLTQDIKGTKYYKSDLLKPFLALDERGYPTDKTDPTEYEAYIARKTQSQPLWKLSKKHVETLLQLCHNSSEKEKAEQSSSLTDQPTI